MVLLGRRLLVLKHFLYDHQINPIDTILEVAEYNVIVKGYSCFDSLVNCILNPDLSYTDLFAYSFKWSAIDRGI